MTDAASIIDKCHPKIVKLPHLKMVIHAPILQVFGIHLVIKRAKNGLI